MSAVISFCVLLRSLHLATQDTAMILMTVLHFTFPLPPSQELQRFPTLQSEVAVSATSALEKMREDGRKTVLRLVDMESSYLTVEFFRRHPTELVDEEKEVKGGKKGAVKESKESKEALSNGMDRYTELHLKRIGEASYKFDITTCYNNTL